VFLVAPSIELVISETKRVPGVLFVTNYQLLLQWRDASGMLREVCVAPLATISKVEKQGGKKAGKLMYFVFPRHLNLNLVQHTYARPRTF